MQRNTPSEVGNRTLSAPRTADAVAVALNPERFADRPSLRRLAWAALMSARGQTVHQARLAAMPVDTGR